MSREKLFSPGEIALVKETIKRELGVDFAELFNKYKENLNFFGEESAKRVTESDLVEYIAAEGSQLGFGPNFDKRVIAGASNIASLLGLLSSN